jgi:hypothetical protein
LGRIRQALFRLFSSKFCKTLPFFLLFRAARFLPFQANTGGFSRFSFGNDGDFNAESSKSHKFLAGMLSELTIVNKPPDMLNYSHRF